MNKKYLNLMCPIGGDNLGYISLNILLSLKNNEINTSLFPIMVDHKISFNDDNDLSICTGAIRYSRNFTYKSPSLKIWHPHDLAVKPGKGKYYALIIPNSDDLTAAEIHHINYTDGILVNSQWAKNILEKHKIKPKIHMINFGVNEKIFNPNIAHNHSDKYIFYTTGSWSLSNGYDFLIKAFSLAFEPKDNVELRLLPSNTNLSENEEHKWLQSIENSIMKNNIHLFNRLQSQYEVSQFIADADCLLSLQRISSTGTSLLEAMSMQKPIIAINCGVVSDYPENDNFFRIPVDSYEKAYDDRIYYGESKWPKLDDKILDNAIDHMRFLYKNNIKNAKYDIGTYDWNKAGEQLANILY
jgi:glycosyltransferase involved in cell wall biosynthesis